MPLQKTMTPEPASPDAVSLADIRAAAKAIEGQVVRTPCLKSQTLSEITGAHVFLKFENHQFTASFKERGAINKLVSLTAAERAKGVIACSAGNHAQGVAYHASRLAIPAVIVMPKHTPFVKVEHTRKHGAEVILEGEGFDDAMRAAKRIMAERGLTFVHPYDDPKIIAGPGTIGLEMLAAFPELDVLVIAVGGGGLISGITLAAKGIKPSIEVYGVEVARFPGMYHLLRGTPAAFGPGTIAEGIAVKEPGQITREVVKQHVKDILLVDEGDIEESVVMLLEIEKTVVEGAGAAGLAAVLKFKDTFRGKNVGLVLCGGNIEPLVLADIVQRGMVRAGRLARVKVEARDLPGSLAKITAIIAEHSANVEEVHHHRAFTQLTVQHVEIDLAIKTRNAAHVHEIVAALQAAGFKAEIK